MKCAPAFAILITLNLVNGAAECSYGTAQTVSAEIKNGISTTRGTLKQEVVNGGLSTIGTLKQDARLVNHESITTVSGTTTIASATANFTVADNTRIVMLYPLTGMYGLSIGSGSPTSPTLNRSGMTSNKCLPLVC
jgi:hypothetical protein